MIGGTAAPIFIPRITGSADEIGIAFVRQSACRIPTDAEEDCIMAVNNFALGIWA